MTSVHKAKGEETRGPRNKNPEPGRTYECEVWCRDASRQLAGCVGFTVLVLTYAVRYFQICNKKIYHLAFSALNFLTFFLKRYTSCPLDPTRIQQPISKLLSGSSHIFVIWSFFFIFLSRV